MSEWEGERVLVTGGASFIGSHLVEDLVEEGADAPLAVEVGLDDGTWHRLAVHVVHGTRFDARPYTVCR